PGGNSLFFQGLADAAHLRPWRKISGERPDGRGSATQAAVLVHGRWNDSGRDPGQTFRQIYRRTSAHAAHYWSFTHSDSASDVVGGFKERSDPEVGAIKPGRRHWDRNGAGP